MNPLHIQLLALFGGNAQLAQDLRTSATEPRTEQVRMATESVRRLIPKPLPGQQVWRHSFWGRFLERRVMDAAFFGTPERQADLAAFLQRQEKIVRRRGQQWPPKVVSCKATALPMPDERRA